MKTLVVYDSKFGNTAQVARAIGTGLGGDTRVATVAEIRATELPAFDLIVVGSPTQGGRPTPALKRWLAEIPADALKGRDVAAFDTRAAAAERGFALRLLMRTIGFAAPKIAGALKARGGRLITQPEGFIVEDTEGPLRAGEIERASAWVLASLAAAH